MAGVDVGPGVEDRDHRLPEVLLGEVAELPGAGPVAEGAEAVGAVPLMTAQVLGTSAPLAAHIGHPAAIVATSDRSLSGSSRLGGRTDRRQRPREARASLTTVTLSALPLAARSSSKRRIRSQTFIAVG